MDEKIIKNVRRLSAFIDDAFLKTEQDKFFMFQSDFTTFHKQIELVYESWFPKAKPCKDDDIINQIFRHEIAEKDYKIWVKYSMACLLNSSKRVYENILDCKKIGNNDLLISEMRLLKEMSFEAAIFMESAFGIIEKRKVDFGHGKRFYIDAYETFSASRQILRKYIVEKAVGTYVLGPTSVLLLRQSIELWLKGIFGINYITDEKNKILKLQPERLFELLKNKSVTLPVSESVITKIHQWTQPYVHAGWMTHTWQIEQAQFVLIKIFYSKNIKIEKKYYDKIESKLQFILKNPKLKLHRLKNPACTLTE